MSLFIGLIVSFLICTCVSEDTKTHPSIQTFLVESKVFSRFANVDVTIRIENDANVNRKAMFSIHVPTDAFITNFSMQIEDRILHGVVKDKKEADEAYEAARDDGQTSGRVSEAAPPPGRGMKNFVVYMNVAAKSEAILKLSYQEIIRKILGEYTQNIHIEPNQVVENLTVVASFQEPNGFYQFYYTLPNSKARASSTSSDTAPYSLLFVSERKRELVYSPSKEIQKSTSGRRIGLNGDIIMKYTLIPPETNGGTLIVNNGAFVHYFSPLGLLNMSKTVIFVIDVSGSMKYGRLDQVKVAMSGILIRLNEDDAFNIIVFSSSVKRWKQEPVSASAAHISSAMLFVDQMKAAGNNNFNDALVSAILDINNATKNQVNLVVFLTDGIPNKNVEDEELISENINKINHGNLVSIFSLGFGSDVNFEFLQKISLQNNGTAYIIYDDEDASQQLEDFCRGIESVTLRDVRFQYLADHIVIEDLTQTNFAIFFNGSEIIVAGTIQPEADIKSIPFTASTAAVGVDNDMTFYSTAEPETGETLQFGRRLWAYQKIKDYLGLALMSEEEEDRERYEHKALTLSLRYSVVTPLTAMVVAEAVTTLDYNYPKVKKDEKLGIGIGVTRKTLRRDGIVHDLHSTTDKCASSALVCVAIFFLIKVLWYFI
ncbi:inter-alpha-trypsin inhibitor heavy chain H4-like [Pecten maximus]|uniref:inter-alpha-trypsin inhibitor heavy chain H4-like n=1 Tax=Pecten maximus TaxID=6579 RepID=UPI001458CAE7|nr:inter-alpha-trypsin inhibitor heavy chain H4-like [Pecten maximus]